jgi:hypothetical protein
MGPNNCNPRPPLYATSRTRADGSWQKRKNYWFGQPRLQRTLSVSCTSIYDPTATGAISTKGRKATARRRWRNYHRL